MTPLLIRSALVVRPCLIDWVVDILVTELRWMSLQDLFLKLMGCPKKEEWRTRTQVPVQCYASETIFLEGQILTNADAVGVSVWNGWIQRVVENDRQKWVQYCEEPQPEVAGALGVTDVGSRRDQIWYRCWWRNESDVEDRVKSYWWRLGGWDSSGLEECEVNTRESLLHI